LPGSDASWGLPRGKAGRIIVGPDLLVQGTDRIFATGDIGLDHLGRIDGPVEGRLIDKAKFERGLFQALIVRRRVVRDRCRLVVADHRDERRDQHQRALDIFGDLPAVRLRAFDQEPAEIVASAGQDRDRLRDVGDHQRLVDIHLEVAAGAAEADRDIVRHDLHRDHGQCLDLGRVDLPRHD